MPNMTKCIPLVPVMLPLQGTNAHVVVANVAPATQPSSAPLPWRRSRCWVATAARALLGEAVLPDRVAGGRVKLVANIVQPRLAFLLDHRCDCGKVLEVWRLGVHLQASMPSIATHTIVLHTRFTGRWCAAERLWPFT
jgi:hypothetical protein